MKEFEVKEAVASDIVEDTWEGSINKLSDWLATMLLSTTNRLNR